jgi:hypothetical protein
MFKLAQSCPIRTGRATQAGREARLRLDAAQTGLTLCKRGLLETASHY